MEGADRFIIHQPELYGSTTSRGGGAGTDLAKLMNLLLRFRSNIVFGQI